MQDIASSKNEVRMCQWRWIVLFIYGLYMLVINAASVYETFTKIIAYTVILMNVLSYL